MKNRALFLFLLLAFALMVGSTQAATAVFNSSGNWTAPAGVTSVTVEAWGGGGAGGGATSNPGKGGGGAGGQYAKKVLTVTSGSTYTVVVGAGGTGGTGGGGIGGESAFAGTSVVAKGGAGGGAGAASGAGGTGGTTGGIGDLVYAGGNGSAGAVGGGACNNGGAGGGGAGSGGAGGNASGNTAGTGTSISGGSGGAGTNSSGAGASGSISGGGGGGACAETNTDRSGGAGGSGRVAITYAAAPIVTTDAASLVAATSVTLNGTVSSNDATTTVTFEYGLTAGYGSTVVAAQSPLAANAVNTAVSSAVSGLLCNTLYHYRVKGVNGAGTTNGTDQTFTTSACVPSVTTDAASAVGSPGVATLNGTVSSNGASTTVAFDYGLTVGYGATATAVQSPLAANALNTLVSASLTGLVCNATYHYRVSGTNSAGTSNGSNQVFTTPICPVVLGKAAGSSAATVGSYVTFSLTARNPNSTDLSNVVLTDIIPTGMAYNTYAATLGTAGIAGQTFTWTIPTLPAGATAQLTLVVQVNQRGSFTNTVTSPGAVSASASVLVLASSYVQYRMDETVGSWSGTSGEVVDSGENHLNGKRRTTSTPTTTNTVVPNPTIASQQPSVVGGFCNAANFDGNAVVESASSSFFQFTNQLSASAWVYPTAYPSELASILSNDTNYEFHLNSSGKLYWWWQASTLTSNTTVPLNQWTHIAITLDSTANRRQRIYINGVQDSATNNWMGTLTANACPFYIGGDIGTGTGCSLIPGRNFRGMIDEVKIYNYELTSEEVQADMTLGRLCSGIFDHVRIEHDGTASTCNSKTVTLKACLNSNCTALYPGSVTVQLSPSGWVGGDVVTINGGVATATLSNSAISVPSVTLGSVSVTPAASSTPNTRCFNGATETCTLSVASTSCAFDAVEPGANPQTHLFTKLAGMPFNVDILALSSPTTINKTYTGTVTVDLVDTSTVACPNGAVLSTAQPSITFVAGDKGRKNVALTCNGVAKSAQVRIKSGSQYSCSSDKLVVRPSAATLMTTNPMATPPSATDNKTLKAGASFNLAASASPSSYSGTLTLDTNKLTAQSPDDVSQIINGGTVGVLTPSSLTANAASTSATYSEVGYLYLGSGAYRDSVFTNVDQISQVPGCAATDTCDCLLSSNETNAGVPDNLSDVLINGRYGCYVGNKAKVSFGRFIPDHFAITPGVVVPGCNAAFTYFGQDGFSTPFTLTAQNLNNNTTANYRSNFAKLGLGTWSNYGFATSAILPVGATLAASATPPSGNWNNGVASVSAVHQISRPAALAGETLVMVTAQPVDGDGVTLASAVDVHTASMPLRFGRLWLGNAYGTERNNLSLPFQMQYWNGRAFITNTLDSCTSLAPANVALGNRQGSLAPAYAGPVAVSATSNGTGTITLTAPGTGIAGSVDLMLALGAVGTPNNCNGLVGGTAAGFPYLAGRWCGAAFDRNPVSRATFGINRGNRQIFLRESF